MSKSKRYQAAGRPWIMGGVLVTSAFPGAKTVHDVGRSILAGKTIRYRYVHNTLNPSQQQVMRTLRKRCLGGEYYRIIW